MSRTIRTKRDRIYIETIRQNPHISRSQLRKIVLKHPDFEGISPDSLRRDIDRFVGNHIGKDVKEIEGELSILTTRIRAKTTRDDEANGWVRVTHELEERSKAKERLRAYLMYHYEKDILPSISSWLDRDSVTDEGRMTGRGGDAILTYKIPPNLAAAFYYSPRSYIDSHELDIRDDLKDKAEEVESHLGPDDWGRWETLKKLTNSQLHQVTGLWRQIEEDVRFETEKLGLREWDGHHGFPELPGFPEHLKKPKENYWMHRLVSQGLTDPDSESWREPIVEIEDSLYKIKVWSFANGAAHSQKKKTLENLRNWLFAENAKFAERKKALSDLSKIQSALFEFKEIQRKIAYDYDTRRLDLVGVGIPSLPNSCSICEDWINKLKRLGA